MFERSFSILRCTPHHKFMERFALNTA